MKKVILEQFLRQGDEVVVAASVESGPRNNIPPDGTRGIVDGFYLAVMFYGRTNNCTLKPGEYHHNGGARIRWADDTGTYVSAHDIAMVDQVEYQRRVDAYAASGKLPKHCFVAELPDTPFWEEDVVRLPNRGGNFSLHNAGFTRELCIKRIDYRNLSAVTYADTPWPAYDVTPADGSSGGTISVTAKDIELVQRGPVWNYYHDIPNTFPQPEDEFQFQEILGLYKEVPNPKTQLYLWTLKDALEACANDFVDGISVSRRLFGSGKKVCAIRLTNREVGERMRLYTLANFGAPKAESTR